MSKSKEREKETAALLKELQTGKYRGVFGQVVVHTSQKNKKIERRKEETRELINQLKTGVFRGVFGVNPFEEIFRGEDNFKKASKHEKVWMNNFRKSPENKISIALKDKESLIKDMQKALPSLKVRLDRSTQKVTRGSREILAKDFDNLKSKSELEIQNLYLDMQAVFMYKSLDDEYETTHGDAVLEGAAKNLDLDYKNLDVDVKRLIFKTLNHLEQKNFTIKIWEDSDKILETIEASFFDRDSAVKLMDFIKDYKKADDIEDKHKKEEARNKVVKNLASKMEEGIRRSMGDQGIEPLEDKKFPDKFALKTTRRIYDALRS